MKFTTTLAALLSASTIILAAPVNLAARDVWAPKILYPTTNTVWHVGETHHVKWALDQKPVNVTNPIGTVFLSKNGRLDIDHPLAKGFNLTDGKVLVTIAKDTVPGSDYAVVLLGDSGNASPTFKILA
ncbi:hypothetical protein BDM02DRAFT_255343 [Thelephora ganbajun]|uniref:Uncharacterized protein n=1 Tax=Thelephora ganbajun TaxID=370292 RepID=A0ACB6Z9I1_THEGA|nr:hypothetical protein BDM02DRAFT_255343 [Thelephora ganbajun]